MAGLDGLNATGCVREGGFEQARPTLVLSELVSLSVK
jgi:hypothetical protein